MVSFSVQAAMVVTASSTAKPVLHCRFVFVIPMLSVTIAMRLRIMGNSLFVALYEFNKARLRRCLSRPSMMLQLQFPSNLAIERIGTPSAQRDRKKHET